MCIHAQIYLTSAMHSFLVSCSGGYNRFDNFLDETDVVGGGLIEFEVGYSWGQRPLGMMFQTGISLSLQNSGMAYTAGVSDHKLMFDTEGNVHTANYYFNHINQKDTYVNLNCNFLLGYKWYNNIYFLVGPKVGYAVAGWGKTSCIVTRTSNYDGLIGEDNNGLFSNMPNHFMRDESRKHNQEIAKNPYVGLFLESGYYLLDDKFISRQKNRRSNANFIALRMSVFAEYGGYLQDYSEEEPQLIVDQSETLYYKPAIANFLYYNSRFITSFSCGVKFTFTMEYKSRICRTCDFQ